MVAFEHLHFMRTRWWGSVGYQAIKLDMSKIYNRVKWFYGKTNVEIGVLGALAKTCHKMYHFSILLDFI